MEKHVFEANNNVFNLDSWAQTLEESDGWHRGGVVTHVKGPDRVLKRDDRFRACTF